MLNRATLEIKRRWVAAGLVLVLGPVAQVGAQTPPADSAVSLKRLSLEELSNLEVYSVSKEPEPYGQAPAAIHVITREDIRRSGATTVPEALRLADNLIVAQKSAHAWAISARGFNTDLANKLLVLIDGRTVYTPLFSGVFWDRQDYLLEDIDRIEVISGPGGALWGANAVNGVINIITKSAADSQGLYAEGAGGSQVEGIGSMRYGGTLASNGFFRVYGKYAGYGNEFFPDGQDAQDSWRMGQTGFRIDTKPSARDALTVQGDLYVGREHLATGGTARVGGGNVLARWSRTLSDDSDFNLQTYYDRTHLFDPIQAQVLNGTLIAPAGNLQDDLDTYDADFQHRFRLAEGHRLSWGLGYRLTHNVVGNAPALGFVPPVLTQSLFSAFLQDEIALSTTAAVIVGSKVEHNGYTGLEVEPSARLQWKLSGGRLVWAAVSRAIRAPARVDRDERLATPALAPVIENLLIGGADFKSENVVAYEGGFRGKLGPAVSTSVSVFYNVYDDLRSTSLSPPDPLFGLPFPLFFENNLEGHTYGVELSADSHVREWWRVHTGYTFLSEDIHVEPGRMDFNNALNETADPQHQFALRTSIDVSPRVELDTGLRWVGAFLFNNSGVAGTVPRYTELNTRIAWQPTPRLELSLVGQNLLHDQHLEYVVSGSNPREEIGRRVYGKAALRW
jgi:iron complex outermembrane recepter protein